MEPHPDGSDAGKAAPVQNPFTSSDSRVPLAPSYSRRDHRNPRNLHSHCGPDRGRTSTAAALLDTKQPNPSGLWHFGDSPALLAWPRSLRISALRSRLGESPNRLQQLSSYFRGQDTRNCKRVLLDIRSEIYSACCWNGAASRNGDRRLREPTEKSPLLQACPTAAQ